MAKGPGTETDRLASAARKRRGRHWTGQDTVLALLFDALQPTNRYFVEFGFNTVFTSRFADGAVFCSPEHVSFLIRPQNEKHPCQNLSQKNN